MEFTLNEHSTPKGPYVGHGPTKQNGGSRLVLGIVHRTMQGHSVEWMWSRMSQFLDGYKDMTGFQKTSDSNTNIH